MSLLLIAPVMCGRGNIEAPGQSGNTELSSLSYLTRQLFSMKQHLSTEILGSFQQTESRPESPTASLPA